MTTLPSPAAPGGLLGALADGVRAGAARAPAAARRALRGGLRALTLGGGTRRLLRLGTARAHRAALGGADPLFPLSHRHYLARGLSPRERLDAALCHYGHEARAFDEAYGRAVYGPGGLVLWRQEAEGIAYDIRLMAGHDLLTEGGLSVVMHVDGARICVLSLSLVPAALAWPGALGTIPFVTRKQLTQERGHQRAMAAALDQTSPAHLCMGAVAGLALAQGHGRLLCIAAAAHPAADGVAPEILANAYDAFWAPFEGEPARLGRLVDLPLGLPPVEGMTSAHRRRALRRRRQVDLVREAAEAAIRARLRRPGAAAPQVASQGGAKVPRAA